jgi:hypothetical protein
VAKHHSFGALTSLTTVRVIAGILPANIGDEVQSADKTQLAQLDMCTANRLAKNLSVIHTPRTICSTRYIQAGKIP